MSTPPIKELLGSFAEREGPDFEAGSLDLDELKNMGILGVNTSKDDFRWIAPRNLAKKTVGPKAQYEPVYFHPSMRERRRIVCLNSQGAVDLVLCVRKSI